MGYIDISTGLVRAARRPAAARRGVVPRRRGIHDRADRRERRGQDDAAAHHPRRRARARRRRSSIGGGARRHGPVRRARRAPAPTVHELLIDVAPRRIRAAARRARGRRGGDHRARRPRGAAAVRDARSPTTRMPAATSTRPCGTSAPSPRSACRSSARGSASSTTLSGGEQKRLVLEALLRGPDEVLLLDEPDNYLDVPGQALARAAAARDARRPCCSSRTTASCSRAAPTAS